MGVAKNRKYEIFKGFSSLSQGDFYAKLWYKWIDIQKGVKEQVQKNGKE